MKSATIDNGKALESRLRREATRKGMKLCRSHTRDRWADDYGLYVLVDDCSGNMGNGGQAAWSAFASGEGTNLAGIAEWLRKL